MKELLKKILAKIKKTPGGMTAYEDLYHICIETKKTDAGLAVKYLKLLSDCIERQIPAADSDQDLIFLFNLHKKVLLAAAPLDFESYLLYVEWSREPEKKFYVPRREVMRPIVQAMQDYDLIHDKLRIIRKHTKVNKFCFYVLVGFKSTDEIDIENALKRIALLLHYHCLPYVMRYMNKNETPWKKTEFR